MPEKQHITAVKIVDFVTQRTCKVTNCLFNGQTVDKERTCVSESRMFNFHARLLSSQTANKERTYVLEGHMFNFQCQCK